MENIGRRWSAAGTVATCGTAYFLPSEIRDQLVFCMIMAFPFALTFCKSHSQKKIVRDYITLLERMNALEYDNAIIKSFYELAHSKNTTSNAITKQLHREAKNTELYIDDLFNPLISVHKIDLLASSFFHFSTGKPTISNVKTVALAKKAKKNEELQHLKNNREDIVRTIITCLKRGNFELGAAEGEIRAKVMIATFKIFQNYNNENLSKLILRIIDDRYFGWHIMSALKCNETSDSLKGDIIYNMFKMMQKLQKNDNYNGNLYAVTQTKKFQDVLVKVVPNSFRKKCEEEGLLDVMKPNSWKLVNIKLQPTLAPTLVPTMFGLQKCGIF